MSCAHCKCTIFPFPDIIYENIKFCNDFCKNEYIKDFKACSVCKKARQVEICDNDCGYGVCGGDKCEFNHIGFKCAYSSECGSESVNESERSEI